MDISPKRGFVYLQRDCAFGQDIVTNISDSFSFDEIFRQDGSTQDKISIKDAKTTDFVQLITGHTRRIIQHTSTVTCSDRDSSPDTRLMYRPSYVRL